MLAIRAVTEAVRVTQRKLPASGRMICEAGQDRTAGCGLTRKLTCVLPTSCMSSHTEMNMTMRAAPVRRGRRLLSPPAALM